MNKLIIPAKGEGLGPLDGFVGAIQPVTPPQEYCMKCCSLCCVGVVFVVVLFPAMAFPEKRNSERGKFLYLKYCETCHGPADKGDGYTFFQPPVANLTSQKVQQKLDKHLWKSLHMGVTHTEMGMWRFVLSDEEIDSVLAYVRSLAQWFGSSSRKHRPIPSSSVRN